MRKKIKDLKNLKNKNYLDKNNLPEKIIPKNKNYKDLTNQNFGKLVALYPCGCLKSKGEQTILSFLQKHNIPFKREQSYIDLLSEHGYPLRFDFLVKDFLIEYQGDIHYKSRESGWNNKKEFLIREQRDKLKKEYCLKNNIHLYEITYKDNCINKLKEILEKEGIIYE